jgi:YebC/PmpR family DNA-binding regulatory protein
MVKSIILVMSGHSKWATIKRQKGAADVKRGLAFTKISNAVTIAVKSGGGVADPVNNFRLRIAIEKAREANMPKDNIERAISKAINDGARGVEEVIYEGFIKGGISVIIEAVTDSSLRTTSEVKSIFRKVGASFGQPGSVAYQFESKGRINIKKNGKSLDEIFNLAAESGAEDLEEVGDNVVVFVSPLNLSKVRSKLQENGLNILDTEIVRKPFQTISIQDNEQREKIISFLQTLEDLDDVQKVYSNLA